MAIKPNFGAFTETFELKLMSSSNQLPLNGLTFAVKDIFDMEGYVTGFGNPDWARTHSAATSTAPAVSAILNAGATCLGRTVMDEMAYWICSSCIRIWLRVGFALKGGGSLPSTIASYNPKDFSINGENEHYGTPINPCASDRVPGGSSGGSAVVVGAKLVDFSLGTDTGGSVRIPASYCNIVGIRPSHGVVPVSGVVPLAQTFDTVGWFARDPAILNRVGRILLQLPDVDQNKPSQILIAEDCFQHSIIPKNLVSQVLVKSVEKLFGGDVVKRVILADYVEKNVPSLKHFMSKESKYQEYQIKPLTALSKAMRLLVRNEFRNNHAEWVTTVKPNLGPGLSERIWEAVRSSGENVEVVPSVMTELRASLTTLLQCCGILAMPTVPGHPPKLKTDLSTIKTFRTEAFALLSIAGLSGFCQVSVPLGMLDGLPISISLLANHGCDGFLLHVVETLYDTLQEEFAMFVGQLK